MDLPRVVYALRHNATNKVYVGSTSCLDNRIKTHMYALRKGSHPNGAMQEDFNNFGDDYSVFVLDKIETIEEARKEYIWMDVLGTRDERLGYNKQEHALPFDLSRFEEIKVPNSFVKVERAPKPTSGFPNNLMRLRMEKGLTQLQFAGKIGTYIEKINRWERGKAKPTSKDLNAVAKALDCSIEDLMREDVEDD